MKVTNHTTHSILLAGKEIKAGETKSIKDKDFEQAAESRVIGAMIEKRCLTVEHSKPKKAHKEKPAETAEESKSFADELKAFHGL